MVVFWCRRGVGEKKTKKQLIHQHCIIMASSSWEERYSRWDKFEGDSDDEERQAIQSTRFDTGEGDITESDVCYVEPQQVTMMNKWPLEKSVVWQITIRKLRVWAASSEGADEGADAIACRPYCLMINNIYPVGKVLLQSICQPPEILPTPKEVFTKLIEAMRNPPDGAARHRPGRIVVVDNVLAGEISKSVKALGIECSQLSESDGVDTFVQKFSDLLVRKDIATRSDASEKSGILSARGVTPELAGALFAAAAPFIQRKTWTLLGERQCFALTHKGGAQLGTGKGKLSSLHSLDPFGTVWVSLMGYSDTVRGLAIYFSEDDLESRLLKVLPLTPTS